MVLVFGAVFPLFGRRVRKLRFKNNQPIVGFFSGIRIYLVTPQERLNRLNDPAEVLRSHGLIDGITSITVV